MKKNNRRDVISTKQECTTGIIGVWPTKLGHDQQHLQTIHLEQTNVPLSRKRTINYPVIDLESHYSTTSTTSNILRQFQHVDPHRPTMSSPVTHHRLFRHCMALPWHIHVGTELVEVIAQAHLVLAYSRRKAFSNWDWKKDQTMQEKDPKIPEHIWTYHHQSTPKFHQVPLLFPKKSLHISPTSPPSPPSPAPLRPLLPPNPLAKIPDWPHHGARCPQSAGDLFAPSELFGIIHFSYIPCSKVCTKVPIW